MPHDKKLSDGWIFWLFHVEAEGCNDSRTGWKSAAERKAGENGLLVQTLTSKEMLPLPEGSPLITATITLGIRVGYSCVNWFECAAKRDARQEHFCRAKSLQMNTVWKRRYSSPGGVHLRQHRWWMPTCKWAPLVWEEEPVHHSLMHLHLIQLGSTQPEQTVHGLQTRATSVGRADLSRLPISIALS